MVIQNTIVEVKKKQGKNVIEKKVIFETVPSERENRDHCDLCYVCEFGDSNYPDCKDICKK